MLKIGPYTIETLEAGRFALDGGAMFGVVPKTLWSREHPSDEYNRIALALRVLLLRSENKIILVDTGLGDKFSDKEKEMYGLVEGSGDVFTALAAKGLLPEDVTDVILTHLHFDHAGGATRWNAGNSAVAVPAFPQAQYWIQQRNWDWANAPSEKDRASYLKVNFAPLEAAGVLNYLEGACEILPHIHAWVSDGHTVGQQLIRIEDEQQALLFCADILPMASHLRLPYIMGYDLHPMVTLEEKRRLLTEALEKNWILVFEHDPNLAACTVRQGKKHFEPDQSYQF